MEIKTLSDVCLINMGQSPDSASYNDKKDGLAFYQGNADFGEIHPTTRVWCNNPIKIAEKDDILISVRAPIGSMNIANERCCIGRGLASIKPFDESICDRNYLYHYLESKVPYMQSKGTGSTFKAINKGILTSLQIKLPNIKEQHKISAIISKIKRQIHNKNIILKKYDELVKSQFIEMFKDVKTKEKLNNVCDIIGGFAFKSSDITRQGIKLLQISNVYHRNIDWTIKNSLPTDFYDKYSQFSLKENDIVIALTRPIIQSIKTVKMGIIRSNDIPCLLNQRVCKITNYKDTIDKNYLYSCLETENFTEFVQANCKGSSQPNISTKDISSYEILLPPIELQNKFADFVKHIDKLKFRKNITKLRNICYNIFNFEKFNMQREVKNG